MKKKIVIVDQFTGRMMPGRAYSDGLHQAIEAKEGVPIKEETDFGDNYISELLPSI